MLEGNRKQLNLILTPWYGKQQELSWSSSDICRKAYPLILKRLSCQCKTLQRRPGANNGHITGSL